LGLFPLEARRRCWLGANLLTSPNLASVEDAEG
jgi:hypothetical protein